MSNKEQVAAVITPAIQALGFYVEDISITSAACVLKVSVLGKITPIVLLVPFGRRMV